MRYVHFKVIGQKLESVDDLSDIVPGTEGYLMAEFEFSDEWSKCAKVASFFTRKGEEHAVLIVDGVCKIPSVVLVDRHFSVKVTGKRKDFEILTNKLKLKQGG